MQEGKVENSSSDTEVDEPVENLATGSLKIREADRAWLEGEQVKLRAKGGKKITQAEMFTRMRAAYELRLAAPPTSAIPTQRFVTKHTGESPSGGDAQVELLLKSYLPQIDTNVSQILEILEKRQKGGKHIPHIAPHAPPPGKGAAVVNAAEAGIKRSKKEIAATRKELAARARKDSRQIS